MKGNRTFNGGRGYVIRLKNSRFHLIFIVQMTFSLFLLSTFYCIVMFVVFVGCGLLHLVCFGYILGCSYVGLA